MPLLSVESLTYRFGDRVAADSVSFAIESGEILGLLGPNGAGKTTTISCIAGLREVQEGAISFDGVPQGPETRAKLGLVPQELALYDGLSARENLEFFGSMFDLDGARLAAAVDRALAIAGLADRQHDRVSTYSGGMKRRLNLAIAELHQPALLILDEPTVGVDPQSRNHIFDALEQLSREGRTLLYTTHYMEEAERLCDRVAIMDEGKVIAIGTAEHLAAQAGIPGADLEKVFLQLTGKRLRDA